jgi:hypothetical protein
VRYHSFEELVLGTGVIMTVEIAAGDFTQARIDKMRINTVKKSLFILLCL